MAEMAGASPRMFEDCLEERYRGIICADRRRPKLILRKQSAIPS